MNEKRTALEKLIQESELDDESANKLLDMFLEMDAKIQSISESAEKEKSRRKELEKEVTDTKKLNMTLARQLDIGKEKQDINRIMAERYGGYKETK